MSTITKEEALAVADLKAGYTLGHADVVILQELARIALASLEAEPVAWIVHSRGGDQLTTDANYVANAEGMGGIHSTPVYTAPPAPVVDADDNFYSWFGREWEQYYQPNNYSLSAKKHLGAIAESAWFACRAAMLQAGNSPVTPDGYVLVPKEMTDDIGVAIAMRANCCGGIALDIYDAMIAVSQREG